jgi:hypothetical protein
MKAKTPKKSVKGVVVTDGRTLDMRIPASVIKVFKGEPRLILKKLEWYGIHPIPVEMLSRELRAMKKDYVFMAVPKKMMK